MNIDFVLEILMIRKMVSIVFLYIHHHHNHLWNLLEVFAKFQEGFPLYTKIAKVVCLNKKSSLITIIFTTIIVTITTTCCTVVIAIRLRANGKIGNQLKIHLKCYKSGRYRQL